MKTRAPTYHACLGALLLLAGCAFASEPPWKLAILTTNASSSDPGSVGSATFGNFTGREVRFGACPFVLERRERGAWTRVPPHFTGDCDGSRHSIDHGDRTTIYFSLAGAWSGTYRLVMDMSRDGTSSGTSVRSSPFHVTDRIPDDRIPR